jgi:hypothetical protein
MIPNGYLIERGMEGTTTGTYHVVMVMVHTTYHPLPLWTASSTCSDTITYHDAYVVHTTSTLHHPIPPHMGTSKGDHGYGEQPHLLTSGGDEQPHLLTRSP